MFSSLLGGMKLSADLRSLNLTLPRGNDDENVIYPGLVEQKGNMIHTTSSTNSYTTETTERELEAMEKRYSNYIIEGVARAKANERKDVPPEELAYLSVWDFAGQEEFYDTHHIFLSEDGIYIFVFNLAEWKDGTNNNQLKGK